MSKKISDKRFRYPLKSYRLPKDIISRIEKIKDKDECYTYAITLRRMVELYEKFREKYPHKQNKKKTIRREDAENAAFDEQFFNSSELKNTDNITINQNKND